MNIPRIILPLFFQLASTIMAQEVIREIAAPQTEYIKPGEITLIAEQKSVLAEDGGYLADPNVVDSFAAMSYQYTGGRYNNETVKFRLLSPDKIVPGRKYPLVVWLHGAGESDYDNQRQLAHMHSSIEFLRGSNKLDIYILATQCPGDNKAWGHSVSSAGKGDAPLTILQEILDQVLDNFPVDQNRISIAGLCSGGSGAWSLLKAKPNFFSAVTVFATSPPNNLNWHEHCNGTVLWAFNNNQDESVPVEPMRRFVNQINQTSNLAYLTVRDGGHDPHILAMRQDKIVAWLVEQDRTKTTPPPGLPIYAYNNPWKPFFLFALPIMLSIPLALLQIIRRWRLFQETNNTK